MKYKLDVTILGLPPTQNSLNGMHWQSRYRNSKKWKGFLALAIGHNKPEKPLEKAKVTMIRCSSKVIDHDGLAGSFKWALDCLTITRIIQDDNPQVIGMPDYRWEKAKAKKGMVRIIVEEM